MSIDTLTVADFLSVAETPESRDIENLDVQTGATERYGFTRVQHTLTAIGASLEDHWLGRDGLVVRFRKPEDRALFRLAYSGPFSK